MMADVTDRGIPNPRDERRLTPEQERMVNEQMGPPNRSYDHIMGECLDCAKHPANNLPEGKRLK
jgi:hypothetical protein